MRRKSRSKAGAGLPVRFHPRRRAERTAGGDGFTRGAEGAAQEAKAGEGWRRPALARDGAGERERGTRRASMSHGSFFVPQRGAA